MSIDRRELCAFLPALLLSGRLVSAETSALSSAAFPFGDMKAHANQSGSAEMRNIVKGSVPTGEQVEVHETKLNAGMSPHPPHRHKHSEFWLIREGTVEITINGTGHRLGAGSVAFAASNDEHSIRNIGDTPATYFVVGIGPM